jgi:hypothetical protein
MSSYRDDPADEDPMEPPDPPPVRLALFFVAEEGRERAQEVIGLVIDFAEQNGLVFDWGATE